MSSSAPSAGVRVWWKFLHAWATPTRRPSSEEELRASDEPSISTTSSPTTAIPLAFVAFRPCRGRARSGRSRAERGWRRKAAARRRCHDDVRAASRGRSLTPACQGSRTCRWTFREAEWSLRGQAMKTEAIVLRTRHEVPRSVGRRSNWPTRVRAGGGACVCAVAFNHLTVFAGAAQPVSERFPLAWLPHRWQPEASNWRPDDARDRRGATGWHFP